MKIMRNLFFKAMLGIFILGLLVFIPFNTNLTFGYNNTTDAPTCSKEKPSQVVLYEPNHVLLPKATGVGEIRLNWLKTAKANKYTVGFGVSSGNYIYGAADVGDTNNFTVRYLTPGKKYFFAVRGVNDCKPGDWSREWSAVVGGRGGTTLISTGSTGGNIVPSPILKRQGTGNVVVPTAVPTVVEQQNQPPIVPENVVQPTPTPRPGFFQRILNLFFGKK